MARFHETIFTKVACYRVEDHFFWSFETTDGPIPMSMAPKIAKRFSNLLQKLDIKYPDFSADVSAAHKQLSIEPEHNYPCTSMNAGETIHPDTDDLIYGIGFNCTYEDMFLAIDSKRRAALLSMLENIKVN